MATQHTLQNNPGALPSMAWMSLLNLLMPGRSKPWTRVIGHIRRGGGGCPLVCFRISGFTVEPRDGDGLQEAQGDDGAPDAEFLQQLDHVGAALRITVHAGSQHPITRRAG